MKRILHITIALLLLAVAGQNAWAEKKTVTYTITGRSSYNTYGEQITFTPSNSGFGTRTGTKVATINDSRSYNGFDVQLDDGVTLRLSVNSGSSLSFIHDDNSVHYGILLNTNGSQNVRFTVECTDYYIIHIKLAELNGNALNGTGNPAPNPSGSLDLDVDIDKATNNNSKYQAWVTQNTNFGQLTITLSDKPRLWGQADGADGSADHPYLISTPSDLNLLATNVNSGVSTYSGKHFLQTVNLTYDGTENNYTAIGTSSNRFSGHYDGNKKTISGININKTGTTDADKYQGLFGYVDGGTIERLALASSTIVGYKYVGGIAGYLNGIVQNCRVENNVTVSTGGQNSGNQDFGGVVGRFESGTVQGCVCGASVTRTSGSLSFCGGIVGSSGGTLRSNVYFGTSVYGINQRECGAILGYGNFSYNNYYTATSGVPKGKGTSSSNIDTPPSYEGLTNSDVNASLAKLLTLGEHVAIDGDVVEYPFSGLTDLGGKALRYDDGNSVRIFTRTRQTITFRYDGEVPEGKSVAFRHCESNSVRPISGTAWTIQGSGNYSFFDTKDSFSIYAALVSDPVTITGKPAMGGYWATFYSSASYNLPEGTVAYTMDSNGQLHPLAANSHYGGLDGKKILGCVAVVLFSDKEIITLNRSNDKWDEDYLLYENILLGSDDPVPVVDGKVDGKIPYVLGVANGVFGFHPFTGSEIPANKAYYLK